jgi:hypothetical protein
MPDYNGYGKRYGSNDYKQAGFFGEIPIANGQTATEYSVGQNIGGKNVEMPSLVPTLNATEFDAVKHAIATGAALPESVYQKAAEHAQGRINSGMSPFWSIPEKQYPMPVDNVNPLVPLLRNRNASQE